MKNMMSVVGGAMLTAMAGYGAYTFVCNNKKKIAKSMKGVMKSSSSSNQNVN